ncbi:MAG: DUF1554 domain-containing protein [Kofleriaceae bacterium]|nr:DUF1554 domain-containing protein [Kofleriaceae bacterium]
MHNLARLFLVTIFSLGIGCAGDSSEDMSSADANVEPQPDAFILPLPDAMATRSRVFVTSSQFSGNLGGLSGADSICQGAAESANLGGNWRAWLSTPTVSAIDRIADVAPWYLPDRTTVVFASHAQLRETPTVLIEWDENGPIRWMNISVGDRVVKTGTQSGQRDETCMGFTSASEDDHGTYGFFDELSYWSSFAAGRCSSSNGRLYCFEQ